MNTDIRRSINDYQEYSSKFCNFDVIWDVDYLAFSIEELFYIKILLNNLGLFILL